MSSKTITVFSNKGGVGKTFVTVNLATALALSKKSVLLVDLDFQAGQDMARMLNLSPKSAIVDILSEIEKSDNPTLIKEHSAVHSSGLDFLPVVKNTGQIGHVTADNIKPFFRKAAVTYDYIIVDAGKSLNETLVTVFDYSNLILLVATPDILAVYQVKWCLDILQSLQFPLKMVKLILNRSESRGSVAWQEVRSALPCEIFSHIPSDGKTVGMALNRGVPCVIDSPKSKVTEAFVRMVHVLRRDDIYVPATEVEKLRNTEVLEKPGQFWEKFGITQQTATVVGGKTYSSEDDEILALKKKIHEKLVERLNLDGIAADLLSNPESVVQVKKTAEEVVTNLLTDEAGGKIASSEERRRLVNDIVNEALGLGALEDFLADPDVTDIMVNSKDELYVEKSGKLVLTNKRFVSDEKMRSIIERIIAPLGRRIDESTPMVDARLPDGSRINAIIPPLSLNGPMITIRKFGRERLEIDDLIHKYHSMTQDMVDFMHACVIGRKNVIVSGGTGAGKTTLLNVISEFIPDNERIITIEDAAELRLKKSHWGRLESRPPNIEGRGAVTIRDLFINCLRMRPDRIVIGECRGAEVLDMLQAMNTGHDGSMTTLHANSTRDVLTRMHSMILLSGIELPVRAINEMVASAIDIIMHINRFSDGTRKITGISEVTGLSEDFHLQLKDIFIFKQEGIDRDGRVLGDYQPTGYVPQCYGELVTRGLPIKKEMFQLQTRPASQESTEETTHS
jgi:septum site-determining protein MinD